MLFSYDFVEAKNEKELKIALERLVSASGFTYKIINIYPKGSGIICWYYAKRK